MPGKLQGKCLQWQSPEEYVQLQLPRIINSISLYETTINSKSYLKCASVRLHDVDVRHQLLFTNMWWWFCFHVHHQDQDQLELPT